MGANQVKAENVSDIVVSSVIKVVQETSQSCGSTNKASNKLTLSGNNSGYIGQDATANVNFKCLQESSQNSDVQQKIQEQIVADLTAKMTGSFAIGNTTSVSNKINTVAESVASVDMKSLAECFVSNEASNEIDVEEGANNSGIITQSAAATTIGDCLQNSDQVGKAIADLQAEYEAKLTSEANYELYGIAGSVALFICCCCCCCIVSILYMFFGGSSNNAASQNGFAQYAPQMMSQMMPQMMPQTAYYGQ